MLYSLISKGIYTLITQYIRQYKDFVKEIRFSYLKLSIDPK